MSNKDVNKVRCTQPVEIKSIDCTSNIRVPVEAKFLSADGSVYNASKERIGTWEWSKEFPEAVVLSIDNQVNTKLDEHKEEN